MNNREEDFLTLLQKNEKLMAIVDEVSRLNLPNWYIAAGSVFQTIWNHLDGKPLMTGVNDIDLIYFDSELNADDSVRRDKTLEMQLSEQFLMPFDVHNEAFMHCWKGQTKLAYTSSENAIERWIATVHAIGITKKSGQLMLFAPFGVEDIFTKTIRPILHPDNTQSLYEAKVMKWEERFEGLTVLSWLEIASFYAGEHP